MAEDFEARKARASAWFRELRDRIVAAFEAGGDIDPRLHEMALAAHYSRGKLHVLCGEEEAAAAELRAALALAPAPPLETEIRALLATLDREES